MQRNMIKRLSRFQVRIGVVSSILILLASVSFGQEIELPSNPLAGQEEFVDKGCVKCHSIFGNGGKVGRDLGNTLSHLGPAGIFAMMWSHSAEMGKLMQEPHKMPIFSEQEMRDFIAFIYFLQYLDKPGDSGKGRMILKQKQCLFCHKVGGEGGNAGPPLDRTKNYAHPLSLARTIWNHGVQMSAKMSGLGIQRPRYSGSEIVDIFAYLREINQYNMDVVTYLKPGRPKAGEKLFESKGCVLCHNIGSRDKEVGSDLTRVDFHVGATEIAARMWNHGPRIWGKMEEKGVKPPIFEESEMADLSAYLYFLNFTEQKGDLEAGKRLFTNKGCVKCHSIRGHGGNVASDLARSDWTETYIKTTTAMWNHNRKMRILMEKVGVPVPRLEQEEMEDLFSYFKAERIKYEP